MGDSLHSRHNILATFFRIDTDTKTQHRTWHNIKPRWPLCGARGREDEEPWANGLRGARTAGDAKRTSKTTSGLGRRGRGSVQTASGVTKKTGGGVSGDVCGRARGPSAPPSTVGAFGRSSGGEEGGVLEGAGSGRSDLGLHTEFVRTEFVRTKFLSV